MTHALRREQLIACGMVIGLALFYLSYIPIGVRLIGLLLFAALALLRLDLAAGFVPLTAPLYLIPAALGGLRERETLLPLHEVVLLVACAAAVARWLWERRSWFSTGRRSAIAPGMAGRTWLLDAAPPALFLAAGLWGALIALPEARSEALRELRWLVVEPLLFYGLLRTLGAPARRAALIGLLIGGAMVALIGVLQYAGIDLAPLLGQKRSFSENVVVAGSVRRVASVYGHANNLGLFLGRVWPLAAMVALTGRRGQPGATRFWILPAAIALLCLAGLLVSFSRGAWVGAAAAMAVLILTQTRGRALTALIALGATGAVVAGLALSLRGEGGSEQTRLLLWREAAGYLLQHPLGIGLDQFYSYHRPDSGRSLIDPALIGTSEEYAAHPHNVLLDIWLRMGPIGLIGFGWLIVRLIRDARRGLVGPPPDPLLAGVLAACTAILVHGLVDHVYFVPDLAITFWLLVALARPAAARGR